MSLRYIRFSYAVANDPPIQITLQTSFLNDAPNMSPGWRTIFRWLVAILKKLFRFPEGLLSQDDQYAHPFAAGATSDLYRGKLVLGDTQQFSVAIKIVKHPAEKADLHFAREAEVWSQLRHENLVPLLGFVEGRNMLISPFYERGHVGTYLEKYPDVSRAQIVRDVTSGLAYLHANQVVHGDLKPSNIMINDQCVACITDFGLSKIIGKNGFTTSTVGTESYMAPELFIVVARGINPQPKHGSTTTNSSDIYSFALLVLEILTAESPKRRPRGIFITEETLLNLRAERMDYATVPEALWEVLNPCLNFKPEARPDISDVSDQLGVFDLDSIGYRHAPTQERRG
ncbi:kinase-like domain-containing protein [Mycena olivaceomarginata]|nr:kinase-like domain-containing protein [Mycena olivaceomarginata]